jgi:transcriptional regulator with XRE-family HTH domain
MARRPRVRSTGAVAAFGKTVRAWRDRRRLSQLELAIRAGTTQRHVSFVEQGRSTPGRDLVLRLAQALELPLRERNSLLLAAGFAPVFPETPLDDASLRSVRAAVQQILDGHLPFPAIVLNRAGHLVAANTAADLLTEGVDADLLVEPINGYRLALHPRGMARRVLNLGQWGRHVTESLRYQLGRQPNAEHEAMLAELDGYLADAPVDDTDAHLGFAVPLRLRTGEGELRLLTTISSFATAVDVTVAELRLEAFLPADDATAEVLAVRHLGRGRTPSDRPIIRPLH